MTNSYVTRTIEPVLVRASREFPAVVLTGPRQSGKTTVLRHVFGSGYRYVSLEPPDVGALAREDPRGFLAANPAPVVMDEIQYAPDLLLYIKEHIDRDRSLTGRYVLSGSQNLLLSQKVTESLAGRAAVLRLLPLSRREIEGKPQALLAWEEVSQALVPIDHDHLDLWNGFLIGGYPEPVTQPSRDIQLWHSSYIQTYLERDVRTLRQVGDLAQFQNFLRILAARSSQLLNLTDISRDLGVAVNSVKAWLSVLEASYQITILRPYYANVGKRLVKTPKVFFSDVGTLCYLAGLKDPEHAMSGPMGGAILETAVLSELVRTITHRGQEPRVFFWRTTAGSEVDFIVETESGLVPIEVKLSSTPRVGMAAAVARFQRDFGEESAHGFVVHLGDTQLPLGTDVTALPFSHM